MRLVPAAFFGSRPEAELARALLDDAGIPATVESDDAGGMYPSMANVGGVRLLVREEDLEDARAVLEDSLPPE